MTTDTKAVARYVPTSSHGGMVRVEGSGDRTYVSDADHERVVGELEAALAATGKQQVGEVEWVRDIHDVEQGLIQRPIAPHAANNAPSPTVRMQVGEVQGDAREVALGILADAYEQDGNDAAARSVRDGDLMYGAKIAVSAIMSALAARQPVVEIGRKQLAAGFAHIKGAVLIDGTVHLVQKGEEMDWVRDRGATLLCAIDRSTRND